MTRPLATPGLSPPRTCEASPVDITDGRTGSTVSVRYNPGQMNPNRLHCMWRIMNIAYTSIGKCVMKTDAKGWKVGGVEDNLHQFNHKSLVGLMSEMF